MTKVPFNHTEPMQIIKPDTISTAHSKVNLCIWSGIMNFYVFISWRVYAWGFMVLQVSFAHFKQSHVGRLANRNTWSALLEHPQAEKKTLPASQLDQVGTE